MTSVYNSNYPLFSPFLFVYAQFKWSTLKVSRVNGWSCLVIFQLPSVRTRSTWFYGFGSHRASRFTGNPATRSLVLPTSFQMCTFPSASRTITDGMSFTLTYCKYHLYMIGLLPSGCAKTEPEITKPLLFLYTHHHLLSAFISARPILGFDLRQSFDMHWSCLNFYLLKNRERKIREHIFNTLSVELYMR